MQCSMPIYYKFTNLNLIYVVEKVRIQASSQCVHAKRH